jgi:hypothetical protein
MRSVVYLIINNHRITKSKSLFMWLIAFKNVGESQKNVESVYLTKRRCQRVRGVAGARLTEYSMSLVQFVEEQRKFVVSVDKIRPED